MKLVAQVCLYLCSIFVLLGCNGYHEISTAEFLKYKENSKMNSIHTWSLYKEDEEFYYIKISKGLSSDKVLLNKNYFYIAVNDAGHPIDLKFSDISEKQ